MKKTILSLISIIMIFGLVGAVSAFTYKSTNEENMNNTYGPYVEEVSKGIGEVTLNFVNPGPGVYCYEYRTDGDTSQSIGTNPYFTELDLYPLFCLYSPVENIVKTFSANEYIEIRIPFGAEQDLYFDWTRFDTLYPRTAEITSPEEEAIVNGDVSFDAVLDDKDGNDSVQWAVRKDSCVADTNTVFGNVDGFHDAFDWDGYNFHALADTSAWEEGHYCFVFNPTESRGDTKIRETRWFYIGDDPVFGDLDFCEGTVADEPTEELGTNRWIWDGASWVTSVPKGSKAKGPDFMPTMMDTAGCSCEQILTYLHENYPEEYGEMEGHWKHGCSKSVLEDFMALEKEVLVGSYTVKASDTGEVASDPLMDGYGYKIIASGVANAGDTIDFDAKYSLTNRIAGDTWTDSVSGYELPWGPTLLDLQVNGSSVDWGTYNPVHEYTYEMVGDGNPLTFSIYDIFYPNNSGQLLVDIYLQIP